MKSCICGTVRNCGNFLNNIYKIMEQIGTLFEDYRIILYYDKSDDNTLNELQRYSLINNKMIYYENTEPLLQYRTHRIAKGRNKCLELMYANYSDYEYFIMMDCDDKCDYNINLNILKMYLSINTWDGLSFNHPSGYYDTWALSKRPFILSYLHFEDLSLVKKYITKIIKKTPKHKLIKCLSAFNGFSIYRTSKFVNCWYDGTFRLDYWPKKFIQENILASGKIIYTNESNKFEDCEHRFFHVSAIKKNNARIMISPLCLFY